jgi:FAD/FMN-containing dehydrogenase
VAVVSELVNDVHSRLNPTAIAEVVRPRSLEELQAAVRSAAANRRPLAVCGGRHAMGGQQFRTGGLLLDTSGLAGVLSLDSEHGLVEVEAGIQWPGLLDALAETPWSIRQKQTGADDLSIGGAVSANVHGRGLTLPPFVGDVERLVLVGADGEARVCSRDENAELFRLACGGYGLLGAIYSVTIRLAPRRKLERVVELADAEELMHRFEERIAAGYLYGDFQFEIDPASPGFLRHGVFSCYRPVADETPIGADTKLSAADWDALLRLAHTDKSRAFELYAAHYLATSGQIYWSDRHQLATYVSGYHWPGSSEMITELYVPRSALAEFLAGAARVLRAREADVVYGTVRLVERDDETVLAWAREPWACTIINLHVEHDTASVERAADAFRALIDVALDHAGSYYLTYHRWARRDQLEAAHPRIDEFVRLKHGHDPHGVFQSDWYRHLVALLDRREAA